MPAADMSHLNTSGEYAPLDPQTSTAETKLSEKIPQDNRLAAGPVDYIANSRDDRPAW